MCFTGQGEYWRGARGMSNLDEDTLLQLKNELEEYMQRFNLTRAECLLIRDAWEYSISQAEMPDFKEVQKEWLRVLLLIEMEQSYLSIVNYT